MDEISKLYQAKNADYGNSVNLTYNLFGDTAYAVRINDKMNRINNLLAKGTQRVKDESLEDTIMDLANYCILWLKERRENEDGK